MDYRKLNLNRTQINNYLTSISQKELKYDVKSGNQHHYQITTNDKDFLFIFYFNNDGTTSITFNCETPVDGEQIAAQIKQHCLYSSKPKIELFLPISLNDFETTIDYLIEECNAIKVEEKSISGGIQIKMEGECGNQLTLKYFKKKGNLQIQGKPLSLYEELIKILCELLPYESIVQAQLDQIKVNIDPDNVKSELESRLPNSFSFIGEKLQAIISPALALNKLEIELEDYTAIAMPVLRGLEGFLKKLYESKGCRIQKNSFGDYIEFNTRNSRAEVPESIKKQLDCSKTTRAIERCYTYWHQQRHALFHVDNTINTTRTIDKAEALDIISKSLDLIDDSYSRILVK